MTSTIEQTADRIVSQEVLCCMSHMVSTLAQAGGHDMPQAARDLAEQAMYLTYPICDYEEAAIQAGWTKCGPDNWTKPCDDDSGIDPKFNTAAECCEYNDLEAYEREVFEFWAVSAWFADKLIEQGEQVDKDFAGLCVWARTTTGQGIAQDSVVQTIAASIVSNS